MFRPRVHEKYFQIAIRDFSIPVDTPPISPIATTDASILMDRLHELRLAFWNDGIFDRHQHRSPAKVSCSLFYDNRHAPVVPWSQILGRIRKFCEEHEYHSSNCSNSGTHKRDSDACSLGHCAP